MTKKPSIHRPGKCGTTKGWNAHNRHNEEQCRPCLDAKAEYMVDWRRRTGQTKSTLYSPEDIAQIRAQALREAADAALFGAYGKGWLRERATQIEEAA